MEQKLQIIWEKPDVREETGEYFENLFTRDWLKRKGVEFDNEADLIETLKNGRLKKITQQQLKKSDNITYKPEDFEDELKELGTDYQKSFNEMENTLVNDGEITLPAPIILLVNDVHYGFAGNRRMNLAFKYGLSLEAWVVGIERENK